MESILLWEAKNPTQRTGQARPRNCETLHVFKRKSTGAPHGYDPIWQHSVWEDHAGGKDCWLLGSTSARSQSQVSCKTLGMNSKDRMVYNSHPCSQCEPFMKSKVIFQLETCFFLHLLPWLCARNDPYEGFSVPVGLQDSLGPQAWILRSFLSFFPLVIVLPAYCWRWSYKALAGTLSVTLNTKQYSLKNQLPNQ